MKEETERRVAVTGDDSMCCEQLSYCHSRKHTFLKVQGWFKVLHIMSVMSVMSVGWGRNARASHCIALPG